MNFQKLLVPVASLVLLYAAWRAWGWPGAAIAGGGLVMWLLLHFTRLMTVLKRAADRPIGHVGSAVMLNAKLRPGLTLMHVIAMTRSLGELRSPKDQQPELYRWSDGSQSHVDCEFSEGRLVRWTLQRPPAEPEAAPPPAS